MVKKIQRPLAWSHGKWSWQVISFGEYPLINYSNNLRRLLFTVCDDEMGIFVGGMKV